MTKKQSKDSAAGPKQDFDTVVFSDYDRTKQSIWDDYEGFVEMYRRWQQFVSLGRDHVTYRSGMMRYLSGLSLQLLPMLATLDEKKFQPEEVSFFKGLFPRVTVKNGVLVVPRVKSLNSNELLFAVTFIEEFMVKAGFKSITYRRDNRGAMQKLRDEKLTS